MNGRRHEVVGCPACEEEGYLDEMLPVRATDIEPRFRTVACEMCGGRGQLELDAEFAKILAAEGEHLHVQIDSLHRDLRAQATVIQHQREQLVQAEAREHALRKRLAELENAHERRLA